VEHGISSWSAATGLEPIINPRLEPPVRDAAPTDDAITAHDQMLFVTYLLDAEGSATWEEVCRIVLRINPAREPDRARRGREGPLAGRHPLR
jgi:hypothetical protein